MSLRVTNVLESCLPKKKPARPSMGRGACLGCGSGTVTLAGAPGPSAPGGASARPPVAAAAAAAWRSHAAVGKFSGDSDRNRDGERAARVAGVTAVHHRGRKSGFAPVHWADLDLLQV